ncbi:MAG: hypothetical protein EON58_21890 [Alphaproteobacteria bacterium]|uniref:hypothetical protein n=1 Tax=Rhizobium sp. PP-CC-3G-465 TaxID=2135648 RepID=UPI000D9DB272|nr:hypothetical protein C8J37_12511 [Rhizobium sp. PP-WC-1G-195]RYG86301.1 MAG: hypothetical protein EON58_21890 [Alphaproteobacteria bacterium]TCQ05468.1 hypothetical protein C8J34_107199 [Rhizobium sp. PP-F2F-G36]TCQ13831.1 hypothetical protein C8J33_1301 [Rhizobium sp. PP-CC-3G-465]
MKLLPAISLITAITIVSGCAPSQQQFEVAREAIRGSSKAQQAAMQECLSKGWNSKSRKAAAIVLDTTEKLAPRVACTRFINAMKSGRLQYADAAAFKQGRPTPEMIKILQGR